jgi:hypothetical protein
MEVDIRFRGTVLESSTSHYIHTADHCIQLKLKDSFRLLAKLYSNPLIQPYIPKPPNINIQTQNSLAMPYLTLTSNYASPLSSPVIAPAPPPVHPSFTADATVSRTEPLRARRGVTFKISLIETNVPPKGHLEPHFSNLPRRRRTVIPLQSATLCMTSTGTGLKSGDTCEGVKTPLRSATLLTASQMSDLRSGRSRDFGMAADGWITLQDLE